MEGAWRAGIFRGAGSRGGTMRQIDPDAVHDIMVQSVRDGMAEGADLVMDKVEKRYGSQLSLVMAAQLISAAAVVILVILALSKES